MSFLLKSAPKRLLAGFTLIELLVGLFGFALVSAGVVALMTNLITVGNRQQGLLFDTDSARKTAFTFMSELRNANTSSTGAYALATAGDQQIVFYSNVDGGTDLERVRYFLENGQLKKGVVKASGSPLAYNLASEVVTIAQRNIGNGANPLFRYFDGSFTGSESALVQPVSVTAVRYVKLDMTITKPGPNGTYTFTAGGALRNLKDNLGN